MPATPLTEPTKTVFTNTRTHPVRPHVPRPGETKPQDTINTCTKAALADSFGERMFLAEAK